MERTSVTGWIPKGEKEKDTIEAAGMDKELVKCGLEGGVHKTKKAALASGEAEEYERVRIVVTVDVENL